jgi:prepilin-type N-terminal cleavage/methylation domain-containing protein
VREARARGFSLVELLVATAITAVCSLAVALMILYGTRLGAAAREATLASSLARARLERLRVLPRGAAQRQPGGSLSADVPAHFDRQGRFTERWTVAAGPAGTQDVTVAVLVGKDARTTAAQAHMLLR